MSLFGKVGAVLPKGPQRSAEQLIRRVISGFLAVSDEWEPGRWVVCGDRVLDYRLSLHLWAEGHLIQMRAGCPLWLEAGHANWELMQLLLQENENCADGSYRLIAEDGRQLVVVGRAVNSHNVPESQLVPLGKSLLDRMGKLLLRLYATNLIERGPDETTP